MSGPFAAGLEQGMVQSFTRVYADSPELVRKRARAFFFFCIAFGVLLIALLLAYGLLIRERFHVAGPPSGIGLVAIGVALLLLRAGRLDLATGFFNAALAVVLIGAQFAKLGDNLFTAYSSFVFLFSLPALTAGLFSPRNMIPILAAVMIVANVAFFILLSPKLSGPAEASARVGFISSLLFQALSGTLIFFTRQILEQVLSDLRLLNTSLNRFVPYEFLQRLGKHSVTELNLGDHRQTQMSVLFCDIRNFTTLTERIGGPATFDLLGSYFERMGPIIRKHNGYIDKYIGDAIMALFDAPGDAVASAQEMLAELRDLNQTSREPLNIGIGIGTGSIVLGAIGETKRIDNTVIGDSVNASARLESLTAKLDHSLIISESTYNGIENQKDFVRLGRTKVKGKSEPITLYVPREVQAPDRSS
ncbi:MAG: adenylate/guanylate cyclase domain-containing protein [Spirochaetales bacterium]|nr:adenylate/guanylate cyclase domain-containing protein [Leptospiraceae bacterium]MCP5481340.1 adenylate/guanylate cyclase domain-containing protein [Spirochaetales bacterium]